MKIYDYRIINLRFLESQRLGDDFVKTMISIYLRDIREKLDHIRAAIRSSDKARFLTCIHILKSHSRDLGIHKTSEALQQIELEIRNNPDYTPADAELKPIEEALNKALEELHHADLYYR